MQVLRLSNNALFLKNLRERTRPGMLFAAGTATVLVTVIIIIYAYTIGMIGFEELWQRQVFVYLADAQALALLGLGAMSVAGMTARERIIGTLDFHRTSPTSPANRLLGLILGAPIIEWSAVLAVTPLAVSFGLRGGMPPRLMLYAYASLVLCAFTYHAVVMAGSLGLGMRGLQRTPSAWPILLLFFFLWTTGGGFTPLYYSTCLPAYVNAHVYAFQAHPDSLPVSGQILFFSVALPGWAYQVIIQVPMLVLAWVAALRKISHPERPALSKLQLLAATAYLLVIYLAYMNSPTPQYDWEAARFDQFALPGYCLFAMFLGFAGVIAATPKYLSHVKALRRMRKEQHMHLPPFADGASHVPWLCLYTAAAAIGLLALLDTGRYPVLTTNALLLALAFSYVWWFAGLLELFQLSGQRTKKAALAVMLALPWLVIPLIGLMVSGSMDTSFKSLCCAFSPFFGMSSAFVAFGSSTKGAAVDSAFNLVVLSLLLNGALALLLQLLAWSARMRLQREMAQD